MGDSWPEPQRAVKDEVMSKLNFAEYVIVWYVIARCKRKVILKAKPIEERNHLQSRIDWSSLFVCRVLKNILIDNLGKPPPQMDEQGIWA